MALHFCFLSISVFCRFLIFVDCLQVHQEDRVILQNIAAFASALHSQGLPVFAGQAASTSELEIPVVAAQIHINAYTFVRGLLTIPVQLRPGPPVGLIITSGNVVLLSDNAFRGKVLHRTHFFSNLCF